MGSAWTKACLNEDPGYDRSNEVTTHEVMNNEGYPARVDVHHVTKRTARSRSAKNEKH